MKILKKFIFPGIIAIVVWSLLFFLRMGETYYALEAFWITGIFLLLQALIYWVSNEGAFYIIVWGVGKIIDMFRKTPKYPMSYFEYVEAKRENRKLDVWPTLSLGAVFFMVGLIWWLIIS